MTIESLTAVFAVLLTISLATERLIELGKPLYDKITSQVWRSSAKLLSAVVIGLFLAFMFKFDLLNWLSIPNLSPIIGYAAAGLLASTGSTTINRLLDWLKSLEG